MPFKFPRYLRSVVISGHHQHASVGGKSESGGCPACCEGRDIFAGREGCVGRMGMLERNKYGVLWGCGDTMGFAIDTNNMIMKVYKNGKWLRRATIENLPRKDTFYAFASPFRYGVSVTISVPEKLPKGVVVGEDGTC